MSAFRKNPVSKPIWIAVFGLIFLISCQDDENISPLLGTWTLKATAALNCLDPSQDVSATFACENSACKKYTFGADGFLRIEEFTKSGINVTEGTYTESNGTLVTRITDGEYPTMRTFDINIGEPNYLYLKEIPPRGSGKCSATTILTK